MRISKNPKAGFAAMAVLLFMLVSGMFLHGMFLYNSASYTAVTSFDFYRQQISERKALEQAVKESILAKHEVRETEQNAAEVVISAELDARVTAMSGGSNGVAFSVLSSGSDDLVHGYFPMAGPAAPAPVAYPETSIAGQGMKLYRYLSAGPSLNMGTRTYQIQRDDPENSKDATYSIDATYWSVPIVNFPYVAYGLPADGSVPSSTAFLDSALPSGFLNNLDPKILTLRNPATDGTSAPDLYVAPAPGNPEVLPYFYREDASLCWNAFERFTSELFRYELLGKGHFETDKGSQALATQSFVGLTWDEGTKTATLDLAQVAVPSIAIIDPVGDASVVIEGSPTDGTAVAVMVYNAAHNGTTIPVSLQGSNLRPIMLYAYSADLSMSGTDWAMAVLLDRYSDLAGWGRIFGNLYHYASPSAVPSGIDVIPAGDPRISVHPDSSVRNALYSVSPRVLMIGTSSSR